MLAWVLRFGLLGVGNPSTALGILMLIASMIIYGVAFDFFNISGSLYVDQETDPSIRSSAQGVFMLMTNGLGATIGTLAAGAIVNHYCQWQNGYLLGNWTACWYIFAAFALVVAVLFALIFKYKHEPENKLKEEN